MRGRGEERERRSGTERWTSHRSRTRSSTSASTLLKARKKLGQPRLKKYSGNVHGLLFKKLRRAVPYSYQASYLSPWDHILSKFALVTGRPQTRHSRQAVQTDRPGPRRPQRTAGLAATDCAFYSTCPQWLQAYSCRVRLSEAFESH